jgi:hypothetical protein
LESTDAIDGIFFEDKKNDKKKLTKQEAREWKTYGVVFPICACADWFLGRVRERLLLPKSQVRPVGTGRTTPKRISGEAAHINKLVEKLKKSSGASYGSNMCRERSCFC